MKGPGSASRWLLRGVWKIEPGKMCRCSDATSERGGERRKERGESKKRGEKDEEERSLM